MGTVYSTTTNAAGEYTLENVRIGSYTLAFNKTKYEAVTLSGVNVTSNELITPADQALPPTPGIIVAVFRRSFK
ncbi:carboxypeptidase-like regulatory domain-containing protein [Deltaproteobacteria bacterium TL4]